MPEDINALREAYRVAYEADRLMTERASKEDLEAAQKAVDVAYKAYVAGIGELTFEQQLMAAVWMVGNMDTEIDKKQWWHDFDSVWKKVSENPDVQEYANIIFRKG